MLENREIARVLEEIADILELQDANPFRVNSYRDAARSVGDLGEALSRLHEEGRLEEIEDVGESIAETIAELLESGEAERHRELLESPEARLVELMEVPGIGPKHARRLWQELGVTDLAALEEAAHEGRIREIEGFGARSEAKILEAVEEARERGERFLLSEVLPIAERLRERLAGVAGVERVAMAGSLRRWRETIGDVDLLVACAESGPVIDAFVDADRVDRVIGRGDTRASVALRNGAQVDLRVVPSASYGAALLYFTGSKAHNVRLRRRAGERGLKLNEYGLFPAEDDGENGGVPVAASTEEEIYEALELVWIPPELREDRGEIEAAAGDELPTLVELEQIRGDCQMHTTASDGKNSIREMAEAAAERGYEYIVITDHSKRVTMADGLDEERLRRQWERIDELADELEVRVLKGVEVDILGDGSLDLTDDCLADADVVVAALHYELEQDRETMTERLVTALDNPHVDILGHPTARRLGHRSPVDVDVERLIEAAAERGVILECNASPERLDLRDTHLRLAKEHGVPVVISTDAHRVETLDHMRYGVGTARRGGLDADDVVNTRPLEEFLGRMRG